MIEKEKERYKNKGEREKKKELYNDLTDEKLGQRRGCGSEYMEMV